MAPIMFPHEWKKGRKEGKTNTDDKYIPIEVCEDILVRLPVKSLVRFKSVSKRWQSLIQSPSFIHSHRRCHSRDHSDELLFSPYIGVPRPTTPSSLSFKFTPKHLVLPPEMARLKLPYRERRQPSNPEWRSLARLLGPWRHVVRVLGPLNNGIYCVVANLQRGVHYPLRDSVVTGKIAFCNPATRDYKFTNTFPSDSVPLLTDLARQPCRIRYGFGSVHRDSIGGIPYDYKVVVVMSWGQHFSSFLSFVYSVRRGAWEKIVDYESGERHLSKKKVVAGITVQGEVHYPEIDTDLEMCPQRFFNGSWHWMAVRRDYTYVVLSFDIADEVFKFICGPPSYVYGVHDGKHITGGVLVLNDHLAAVYFTARASSCRDTVIDVWMMMDYGVEDSWTKIYTVKPICDVVLSLVGISSSPRDDCIGGIRIEKIIFHDCYEKLISCDESGVEDHGVYDLSSSMYWNTFGISAYSETLEPLNISVEDGGVGGNSG